LIVRDPLPIASVVVVVLCAGGSLRAQTAADEPSSGTAAPSNAAGDVQRFEPAEVTDSRPPVPLARASAPELPPLTMDEIAVGTTNSRVTLNVFGDTGFKVDSVTSGKPAFVLGPLDLLLSGRSGNLVALSEIALETDAASGEIGIDLERGFVGWHAETFSIDAGRTHTELGYWNNAFHHGRWLQMPVDRPRAVLFEDEGGILPIHSIGVTGRWRVLTGEHQVELMAAVGNGRGVIVDNLQLDRDDNLFKSLLLKIEAKGFGARELRVGLSSYYDRIASEPAADATGGATRPALPDQTIGELIGNAYLAYRGSELTVIAEAFDILHSATGGHWNTFDGFGLIAYRFGTLVPYATVEVRSGDVAQDPFFFPDPTAPSAILARFDEATAGLRWDLNTWSALKIEYRPTRIVATRSWDQREMIDWTFGL
jgi:hypothetical protein